MLQYFGLTSVNQVQVTWCSSLLIVDKVMSSSSLESEGFPEAL